MARIQELFSNPRIPASLPRLIKLYFKMNVRAKPSVRPLLVFKKLRRLTQLARVATKILNLVLPCEILLLKKGMAMDLLLR